MSKPHLDPSNFDQLQEYVANLFPAAPQTLVVTDAMQQQELQSIERTIGSERFYFVVDMPSFRIIKSSGIQQWLGYYEKEFTLKKYWGLVHPGMQKSVHTIFIQLAELLCLGKFQLDFMVQRYSSLIALKNASGRFVLLKRTASVFQYDNTNRLTEYLNEFTIIGDYNGESLLPFFFDKEGKPETQRGDIVMQQAIKAFLGMNIFSPQELQVARLLAYQPDLSQVQVAALMHISPATVPTYYKRFLKKSRDYFHQDFASALEGATYLRKSGLL